MAASSDSLRNEVTPAVTDGTVASAIADAAGPGDIRVAEDRGGAAGWRAPRRWLVLAAWAACFAVAFVTTLRLSQTIGSNSDSAAPALQGWDMLHGNLLQHGWITADVPYFPTEVTEDALIVLVRGLNSDAVHWGGAFTYTLIMLFAALLAMGRRGEATGRERLVRAMIAAGIMIAPQLQAGTYTLLLGPDHTGTSVPVLVAWLIIDRAPRRWYVPVAVAFILGWTGVADLTALFTGALPLVSVCAYRVLRGKFFHGQALAAQRYEIALAVAGVVAAVMAVEGQHILIAMGSVTHAAPQTQFASLHAMFGNNLRVAGECLLILAGADFIGVHSPAQVALASLHLVGAALGAAGIVVAAWRFLREADVICQLLLIGIVLNLATFVIGTHAGEITYAREMTDVLPFAGVLAGRLLTKRLLATRLAPRIAPRAGLAPVLAVVLVGYLAGLAYEVHQPRVPAQNAAVVPFLKAHHLTSGLSGYWAANVITVDTGGQVAIRSLDRVGGKVAPSVKLVRPQWYDPRVASANFVVLYPTDPGAPPAVFSGFTGVVGFPYEKNVVATFGPPARTYHYHQFTILVWNKNLLADLRVPIERAAG
jgi:hypothetical protein